jgi:electron transfer DM13
MKKWRLVIPVAAVAAFLAWYAFRPERLLVNRRVNEAMPAAQGSSSPQPLVSGQFYSILHPTAGTATIYRMGDGSRVLRFTGFSTSNGPDVHVYMVAADDAKDNASCCAQVSSIWGPSRGTWATKTIPLIPKWTWRNIARFQSGANGSASILALLH